MRDFFSRQLRAQRKSFEKNLCVLRITILESFRSLRKFLHQLMALTNHEDRITESTSKPKNILSSFVLFAAFVVQICFLVAA